MGVPGTATTRLSDPGPRAESVPESGLYRSFGLLCGAKGQEALGHPPCADLLCAVIITFLFSRAAQRGPMPFSWGKWPPSLLLDSPVENPILKNSGKAASGTRN